MKSLFVILLFNKMVNETETPVNVGKTPVDGGSGSGVTASAIDWTMYRFSQPIDLSGMPDKFSGGGFFFSLAEKDEALVNC